MDFNDLLKKYLFDTHTDLKTVFLNRNVNKDNFTIYPYFFNCDMEEEFIENSNWIGSFGGGTPTIIVSYSNGIESTDYDQYGGDNDKFPLIHLRDFHSMKKSYIDISEEFILYFNLYKDKDNFILIDDGGNESIAISIYGTEEVKIKTNLLFQFMSIKNYSLSLNFDLLEYEYKEEFNLNYSDVKCDYYKGNSEFGGFQKSIGKKIIKKSIELKKNDKKYGDFIIGIDKFGENLEFNSNYDNLSNNFVKKNGIPHYLTPIFFRKEVLEKYYSQTEKYTVIDGELYCGGKWMLRLDLNNPNFVTAYLGDLGRDLPYTEHHYWKSFNVPPNGKISEVEFKRSFMAEFTNPTDNVLIFKELLYKVNEHWNSKFQYDLFKQLNESDEHYYKSFRIPLTNEQKDFDGQILSLSKIILESINTKEINKYFRKNEIQTEDNLKGINGLKLYLKSIGFDAVEVDKEVGYFNMLYDLRSKLTAHRKSEGEVTKILTKHQLLDKDNKDKMIIIMERVNFTLNWLIKE